MKKAFNGTSEFDIAPIPLLGHEVFDWVKNNITIYGNTQKRIGPTTSFGRKSLYSLICLTGVIYM